MSALALVTEVLLLILCTEISFLDMQEPKLENVFSVINKLLACSQFKRDFFVDFIVAASSENGSLMETSCLLGQLISLSIVVRDDFSDVKRVRTKIEEKIMACKSKSGYQKTLQVIPPICCSR